MPTAAVFAQTTASGAASKGQVLSCEAVALNAIGKITITDMTLPDPYVPGGIPLIAAQLGLTTLDAIIKVDVTAPIDGTVRAGIVAATPSYLWVSVEDAGSGVSAEVGAADATAYKVRITAIGS